MEKLCTKEKILKEYSIILKHWKSWKRIRSNGDLLLDYFSIRILYPNVTRDINRGDKIDKGIQCMRVEFQIDAELILKVAVKLKESISIQNFFFRYFVYTSWEK